MPRYLFPGAAVVGLQRLAEVWPSCAGHGVVVLGLRCYMAFREPGQRAPPGPGELEVCRDFRVRWELEPVTEAVITNRTNLTFDMYPDAPTLAVGVYRIRGPRSRAPR